MRKFQCFQNTRFLQLTVLFKLVKDKIPDEGRNAQMMRCRIRLNQMLFIILYSICRKKAQKSGK